MPSHEENDHESEDTPQSVREIAAEKLFEAEKEIVILHDGNRYRLRITRKNKLILQK